MPNKGIIRLLQISLTSLLAEVARGQLVNVPLKDILSREVQLPGFAVAVIKTWPIIRFTLIHPETRFQLHYLPRTDIAKPFFYKGNLPLRRPDYTLKRVWPGGMLSLFETINSLERFLEDLMQSEGSPIPYKPLLPAWRTYHSVS